MTYAPPSSYPPQWQPPAGGYYQPPPAPKRRRPKGRYPTVQVPPPQFFAAPYRGDYAQGALPPLPRTAYQPAEALGGGEPYLPAPPTRPLPARPRRRPAAPLPRSAYNYAVAANDPMYPEAAPPAGAVTAPGVPGYFLPPQHCLLDPEGKCYRAGQFCPESLHDQSVAGENAELTCRQLPSGYWHWE